jgi:hypothetical protein
MHCKTLNCLESSSAPPKGAAETWGLGVKGNQISAAPNLVPRANRTVRREKGPVSTFHASELCGIENFINAYMIFLGAMRMISFTGEVLRRFVPVQVGSGAAKREADP